jgi:hypothetical protein
MMEGYTDNYIRVTAPYQEALVNNIVDWKNLSMKGLKFVAPGR